MYWSKDDAASPLIARSMGKAHFEKIKKYIHFADDNNNNLPADDKLAKISSLQHTLNNYLLQFGVLSINLSIDKQMVLYFEKHWLKMLIPESQSALDTKTGCLHQETVIHIQKLGPCIK